MENVRKRYLISAAAHNLGCLMRTLFKMGTPRGLQQFRKDLERLLSSLDLAWIAVERAFSAYLRFPRAMRWKNDHRVSYAACAA